MNRVNASMPLREQAWAVSECAGFVFGLGAFASRADEIHRGGGYLTEGLRLSPTPEDADADGPQRTDASANIVG